jgi:hypothetical protein
VPDGAARRRWSRGAAGQGRKADSADVGRPIGCEAKLPYGNEAHGDIQQSRTCMDLGPNTGTDGQTVPTDVRWLCPV